MHNILSEKYTENVFTKTCQLFIKKYFDYKDLDFALNSFAPNLNYEIRGLYFVPMRVDYSNILYMFPKDKNPVKIIEKVEKSTKTFRIMKTMKPDVYDLYLSKDDSLMKSGIALVQSIELSHSLLSWFKDKDFDSEILVECKYNEYFKKWEPISLSDDPISEL